MLKNLPSAQTIFACLVLGAAIGFFVGGGWQIVFDFDNWKFETFYRADGLEIFCFLGFVVFGGLLKGAGIGALFGVFVSLILGKSTYQNSAFEP